MSNHRSSTVHSSSTLTKAEALLAEIAKEVVTDDPLRPDVKKALTPSYRIPNQTLVLVGQALREHPTVPVEYDSASVDQAIAYEASMRPLAQRARELADRIDEQILVRRARAVESSFAAYGVMKGLLRSSRWASLRPAVKRLSDSLKLGRKKAASSSANPPQAGPPPKS